MAANRKSDRDDVTQMRTPLDISKRLPFEHIIEKHKDKYDFCIINDAKYSVQRHEMNGWKVWDQDTIFESDFEKKTEAGRPSDGFACVPCGIAGEGKPTKAYLMYAPKGHGEAIVRARHAENRQRKAAYGAAAENAASNSVGGAQTYTPTGFGQDGFLVQPDTNK